LSPILTENWLTTQIYVKRIETTAADSGAVGIRRNVKDHVNWINVVRLKMT